ncbi:hypothetical protein EDB83DRAFT_1541714 [Lactarius deliciosus]|nr:hypothetical protein EDB83DRAFT_1541714 [Lactarius deliciosus]
MSLVWSTPIVLSGLGLTPATIGMWLSAYGCASALPVPFFPHLVTRFGPGRAGVLLRSTVRPLRMCWLATAVVWPLIALQLLLRSVSDMGFGMSLRIFLTATFFNLVVDIVIRGFHVHLVHGAEEVVALCYGRPRADGRLDPARGRLGVCGFVRTFSLQNNVLGGYFAYVVVIFFVGVALCFAIQRGIPGSMHRGSNSGKSGF